MDSKDAAQVAITAHGDQVDKQGVPYFWHALRVAGALAAQGVDDELVVVGALHDVMEDTDFDLINECDLTERQIRVLDLLTHKDSEPYLDYVRRCAADDDARIVKMADMIDNVSRLKAVRSANLRNRLEQKYKEAWPILLAAHRGDGTHLQSERITRDAKPPAAGRA